MGRITLEGLACSKIVKGSLVRLYGNNGHAGEALMGFYGQFCLPIPMTVFALKITTA